MKSAPRNKLLAFATACLVLCLHVLCVRPAAHAQIVNVQPLIDVKDIDGLSGVLEGAIDWRTGNTELLIMSASLIARYRFDRHLWFLLARAEYAKDDEAVGEDEFLNREFQHLRYRWETWDNVQFEAFAQRDRDDARDLQLRTLMGAGPRLVFAKEDVWQAAWGAAYMFEIELLDDTEAMMSPDETYAHRLSSYLSFSIRLDDRVRLAETIFVQPRLDDWDDARLLFDSELLVKLGDRLSLKSTFSLAHDTQPPPTIHSLDTTFKTSLQFRFY